MTYEQYMDEHGNDPPYDPDNDVTCPVCGCTVCVTGNEFSNGSIVVHAECLKKYLDENFTTDRLAELTGFDYY